MRQPPTPEAEVWALRWLVAALTLLVLVQAGLLILTAAAGRAPL